RGRGDGSGPLIADRAERDVDFVSGRYEDGPSAVTVGERMGGRAGARDRATEDEAGQQADESAEFHVLFLPRGRNQQVAYQWRLGRDKPGVSTAATFSAGRDSGF